MNPTGKGGFKPGQSGNPGGRPGANAEVRDLARRYMPAAIKELARLALKARSEAVRISAIRELFDRGYGKAPSPLVHFELPVIGSTSDAANAIAGVVSSVSRGEISLAEAADVSRLVEVYAKTLESSEYDKRLRALEAAYAP